MARLAVVVGALVLVVATTPLLDFEAGVEYLRASDVASYRLMAEAAPGLPTSEIGSAYTGRFGVHYGTGLVSSVTGLSVPGAYRIVWASAMALLLLTLHFALKHLKIGFAGYALATLLFVLNPFALRPGAITPATVADVVFSLGVAITCLGLLRKSPPFVLAGLAVAIFGRQSALVVAPAVALWLVWAPTWRQRPAGQRAALAACAIAIPVAMTFAIGVVVASFTTTFQPRIPQDTILPRLARLPADLPELMVHLFRTAQPLVMPVAVIAALLFAATRRRPRPALPSELWGNLLVAAAVVIQPLAIDSAFPGLAGNEQRLSALGLFPLVIAAAVLLRHLEEAPGVGLTPMASAAAFGMLALHSLHPVFSTIGPGPAAFIALQLATSVAMVMLLLHVYWSPSRPHQLGRRSVEEPVAA